MEGDQTNLFIFSDDKKFLMKIISNEEKDLFLRILPSYHKKLIENKSLLCRIYGLFRIIVNDKKEVTVILMRNMCELPSPVNNIFTFKFINNRQGY